MITSKIDKCIGKQRPTWSPNGERIAFTCLNSKGFSDHDVWSVNADGTGLRQISKTHDAYFPAWSPRGDKIAYVTYGGAIYTVPANGGASTLLIEEAPGGVFGGISSGSTGLRTATTVSDSSGDGIYTINATTGATSADLADGGSEPVFSPDGKKECCMSEATSASMTTSMILDADQTTSSVSPRAAMTGRRTGDRPDDATLRTRVRLAELARGRRVEITVSASRPMPRLRYGIGATATGDLGRS